MSKNIILSNKEILTLEDKDFLLTKGKVLDKIYNLMEITRDELKKTVESSDLHFPVGIPLDKGKISKGERYRKLPYMVLDYPALFSTGNIFAYRTMFWWGNFFSATLHLEGSSLHKYKNNLSDNLNKLLNDEIYICIGDSPWHYHYGKDNYIRLSSNHRKFIVNSKFLKVSKKIELNNWRKLPEFSTEFLILLSSSLKPGGN